MRDRAEPRSKFQLDDGGAIDRALGIGPEKGVSSRVPRGRQSGTPGGIVGRVLPLGPLRRPRHHHRKRLSPQEPLGPYAGATRLASPPRGLPYQRFSQNPFSRATLPTLKNFAITAHLPHPTPNPFAVLEDCSWLSLL